MYAIDFEYDGQLLSDFGFMICDFDGSSGANIIDSGCAITFTKVKRNAGLKHGLANTQFDDCLTATFHIAKRPEECDEQEISADEFRDLVRWLNRHQYLPFRIINEIEHDKQTCYYNASFNFRKITIAEHLYGIELTVDTDAPFGYGFPVNKQWNNLAAGETVDLYDYSDDTKFFVPDMSIKVLEAGNLKITNSLTGSSMEIKNCSANEVITIYGDTQVITTSKDSHKIYNDFNFDFLRIGNTYKDKKNVIKVSIPCNLTISYQPIIKDAL